MKTLKFIPLVLIAGLLFGCESESPVAPNSQLDQMVSVDAQSVTADAKTNTKSTADIFNGVTGDIIGESTLHRNGNGITVNFKTTTGLMPGHAYTLWWVVWNNPESCAGPACGLADFPNADLVKVELLYAAGSVAGNNGKGNFSAHLKVDDTTGSVNADIFGLPSYGGLLDAHKAEIHAVLRSHGPKVPGLVNEQINSYEGGCVVNFAPFTEIPDEVGECGDIIAAIHFPL